MFFSIPGSFQPRTLYSFLRSFGDIDIIFPSTYHFLWLSLGEVKRRSMNIEYEPRLYILHADDVSASFRGYAPVTVRMIGGGLRAHSGQVIRHIAIKLNVAIILGSTNRVNVVEVESLDTPASMQHHNGLHTKSLRRRTRYLSSIRSKVPDWK